MIIGNGKDPFQLVEAATRVVKQYIREDMSLPPNHHQSMKKFTNIPTGPQFANYLGWCTWDSFYTVGLSPSHILIVE